MDETRAVAKLPNLDIEILHRRLPGEDAEQLLISLRAVPLFEPFARWAGSAAPSSAWLALNPLLAWQRAAIVLWAPWLAAASRALPGAAGGAPERDRQP